MFIIVLLPHERYTSCHRRCLRHRQDLPSLNRTDPVQSNRRPPPEQKESMK